MKKILPILIIMALFLILLLPGCAPPEPDDDLGCYQYSGDLVKV